MIIRTKTITILIAGAVFTAGLMMSFGGYVFAGDPVEGMDITIKQNPSGRVSDTNYDSSFSKTKSIGQVRMEVGNVLLGYGFGGKYINQVTEALEGNGVYGAELKSFFIAVGLDEIEAQNILLEFDKIGISKNGAQGVSTPGAGGAVPSPSSEGTLKQLLPSGISPSKRAQPAPATTPDAGGTPRTGFKEVSGVESQTEVIEIKDGDDRSYRRVLLQQGVQALRQDLRENAKDLRDNFRERSVREATDKIEKKLEIARIALAHGKGLRMVNRFRSAIARFNHILGRLESRVEKIGIEIEAQGIAWGGNEDGSCSPRCSVVLLIEEAKNTQVENQARLAELQDKYESLLLGENPGGIAKEAREIAKELKAGIEKLHGQLRAIADEIKQAYKNYKSSLSNTKSE